MFDRYSEDARQTIFWARYEASQHGNREIGTEHLLLGLLRSDEALQSRLSASVQADIRQQIESKSGTASQRVPTSVDMPLSADCRRALGYAAGEADALGHRTIVTGHLVLGLLRIEECMAARLLRAQGIDLERFREVRNPAPAKIPAGPQPQGERLRTLVDNAFVHLGGLSEDEAKVRLKHRPWTRKEAIGHLIDWACAHQQWIARALTEPSVAAAGYPGEEWPSVERHAELDWIELAELWAGLNHLLIHVMNGIPAEKLAVPVRIGIQQPVTLGRLADDYIEHCEGIVGEILARN